jgi:ADP-ribose pyrophosphatase
MRVREDAIRRRDGSSGIFGVVEKPDFVAIVPVEDDGFLYLVQQFRYPVQGRYWKLPQGFWEQAPGADPIEAARSELREETGLAAARMTYAGHLFEASGYSNQGFHIFVATDLRRGEDDREPGEQDLVTQEFPLSEVERMIREGEIKDVTTVAALGLLRLKGLL